LQIALFDQQLKACGGSAVAQEFIESGNCAKSYFLYDIRLVDPRGKSLSIKGGQPGMNQFVRLRGFGKKRDHRKGSNQNNEKDTD